MLPAHLYQYFYLFIVTIATIACVSEYKSVDSLRHKKSLVPPLLLLIFMIFFIGLRPIDLEFIDMFDMSFIMDLRKGQDFAFDWNADNLIYDNLYNYWCSKDYSKEYFFLIFSTIYFSGIFIATRKMFRLNTLLVFLIYLGAFSTFSFGTNGIKAGTAASLFLVAVAYRRKLYIAVPFMLLSLGVHHSMTLPIGAFIIAYFFKDRRYYLAFWFICLFLSAFHVTYFQELLSGYTDEQGASYLEIVDPDNARSNGVTGFRPDFILYSAMPIFLGYYFFIKKELWSSTFDFIWCIYVLCNGVWLLCTYASFTNRIAYLSWFIYPFVLAYPFVNFAWSDRQEMYLRMCVYLHLGFTIFMNTIYPIVKQII